MIPWTEIAIKTPELIYKNRATIQKWWTNLLIFSGLGRTDVVILGRPSVGKSVLSSHLHGETSNLTYELPLASIKVETKAIQLGDWTKIIRVLPGQTNIERLKGLEEALHDNNGLEGVIYVVDWGYTNVRNEAAKENLIQNDKIDTVEKLREINLINELEDFKSTIQEIEKSYANYKTPKWLVIAVNKIDLFYSQINDAQKYYDPAFDSEFTHLLNSFLSNVGKQNLKCLVLPISSWDTSFEWNSNIIKTNLNGAENRHLYSRNFILNIAELQK